MAYTKLRTFREAVAVVTGGASGIGAAIAREIARRGATVLLADRQQVEAGNLAAEIAGGGGRAEAEEVDVRDADAVERLVAGAFERHGRLDYLFNNAGIGIGGVALEYSLDDWRYMVEVNLMGVVHGVQAAYRRMVEQGFGHIVNTASMAGLAPAPFMVSYGMAKHGVVGLTRALRVEAREHGVRVSAFCPGVIRTAILEGGRYGRFLQPIDAEASQRAWERIGAMDAAAFAAGALDQVAANREIIILPTRWRWAWRTYRLFPGLADLFVRRSYREMQRLVTSER